MTPGQPSQPVSQSASASQTSFPDPRHMRGGWGGVESVRKGATWLRRAPAIQ